ncbi:uncharacterized protein LOC119838839 [Zerene cesonia]|uniref:uncharacterized protein LOC119838839 n=1 Tax=Zerene cesonia TaxID=33412 RepID=UPI0018E5498B|nr:uncharacterized protein LOC119838839 [Zerene cesonia]
MGSKKNLRMKKSQLHVKSLKLLDLSRSRSSNPVSELAGLPDEQPASRDIVYLQLPAELQPVSHNAVESKKEYVEYSKKRNPSSTWNYFLTSNDRQSAKCKICSRIIKTAGSSTSGLHGHLRSRHKITIALKAKKRQETLFPQVQNKHTTIDTNLLIVKQEQAEISFEVDAQNGAPGEDEPIAKKIKQEDDHPQSMMLLIARMAALDGIPLSKFCTSLDLRCLFDNAGYNLPNSVAEVVNILIAQCDVMKAELEERIDCFKSESYKFCLSFQQYQTSCNQIYVAINIHNKDPNFGAPKNLGLFKVTRPIEFDELLKTVSDYLSAYKLTLNDDITAFTCDSSLIKNEVGIYFKNERQSCLAQAIQHAVIDVLYRKESIPTTVATSINSDESDEDSTDDNEMNDPFFIKKPIISTEPQLLYKNTIDKVRKLVRYFKNSTSRYGFLQTLVKKKYEKEIDLIIDCKKRWSTLCEMIGRFLKMKEIVKKCVQCFNVDLFTSDEELRLLTEIHDSLVIIKATVTALCKPNANLLTADAALRFMLRKLDEQDNDTSRHFAMTLREHIQRRRTTMSSLLQYLHDHHSYDKYEDCETFKKPTAGEFVNIIVSLLTRLKQQNDVDQTEVIHNYTETNEQSFDDPLRSEEDEELSIEKQLEKEINNSCHDKLPVSKLQTHELDLKRIVMGEICIYNSVGGSRGTYLTMAYEYLLCVVPAIAEAEQYFYSSKQAYKTLSSHPSRILSTLFFLKSYIMDQKLGQ